MHAAFRWLADDEERAYCIDGKHERDQPQKLKVTGIGLRSLCIGDQAKIVGQPRANLRQKSTQRRLQVNNGIRDAAEWRNHE